MNCMVLIKKDVVLFKKEAARISVRETVFRGKLWAIKRGER